MILEYKSLENDIYNTSDRILNPLFPLWMTLKIEVPFENQKLKRLTDYVYNLKELLKQDGINIVDDFSNKKEVIKNQYKNTPKINRDVEKKTFKLKEKPNSKNQEQER